VRVAPKSHTLVTVRPHPKIGVAAPLLYRAYSAVRTYAGYCALAATFARAFLDSPLQEERRINELLKGYPSNHIYRVHGKRLIPSSQLYERLWKITPLFTDPLESFLDVGCCKGYYTCLAARKPTCKIAAGIDVHAPFIETSKQVSNYLGFNNTHFHMATIDKVAEAPADFGGPYQTILLIGTYHYLFWGSAASDHCFRAHREILSRLATLCTDRVLISGRLELNRLPRNIRKRAIASKEASQYDTRSFVQAAEEFFTVNQHGFLGTYPLFVLKKK
jgi:hypothetical protein